MKALKTVTWFLHGINCKDQDHRLVARVYLDILMTSFIVNTKANAQSELNENRKP